MYDPRNDLGEGASDEELACAIADKDCDVVPEVKH